MLKVTMLTSTDSMAKIIESVEVSYAKVKVFFEGCGHTFNLGKFRFRYLLCSRFKRSRIH